VQHRQAFVNVTFSILTGNVASTTSLEQHKQAGFARFQRFARPGDGQIAYEAYRSPSPSCSSWSPSSPFGAA
jgi:hypothetical protein